MIKQKETKAKMNSNSKVILKNAVILLAIGSWQLAKGQTVDSKNLGNEDITIVKEYQPVLNDAFKISLTPQGDTSTSPAQLLKYNLEPQQITPAFNITPIKPVKIKDEVIKKLYNGFVKAGYGNYNTPLVEVYYNSLRSKEFDLGVHIKHQSSSGAIKGFGYPGYSISQIGLTGTKFFDKSMLDADIDYSRDVYHFYGYQNPPDRFTKGETKHLFSDVSAKFAFADNNTDKDAIKYKAAFAVYNFRDNFDSDESSELITGYFGKNILDGFLKVNLSADLNQTHQDKQDLTRNIFTLEPLYQFHWRMLTVTGGANSSIENTNTGYYLHLYPHVEAKYQVVDDVFSIVGKWGGEMQRNNYRSIAKENQFLDRFTIIKNTNDKLDLSLAAYAKLSHDVNANASVSYKRLVNNLFFVNENVVHEKSPVKFKTLYDDVNLITVHGQMDYNTAEKTAIGLNIDFNSYSCDQLDHPLYKPLYKIGLSGKYTIADKIEIKPEINFNGNSYGFQYADSTGAASFKTIKGYVDLNLGVEYHYTKILKVFVQLNNIGMSRYYYWYNYPNRWLG